MILFLLCIVLPGCVTAVQCLQHEREAVGIFSLQTGSGAGLHSVPAEGAGGLADPSGGVCEGAERDHLPAARG